MGYRMSGIKYAKARAHELCAPAFSMGLANKGIILLNTVFDVLVPHRCR